MTIKTLFPVTLHVVLAAGSVGLADGLHHVTPVNIVQAYTATGFAIGFAVTALVRCIIILIDTSK